MTNKDFFLKNGISHGKIQLSQINMHYLSAGKGEPVVLLHGWPQYSLSWKTVMAEMKDKYHVLAPDLRGSGGTTITNSGYDKKTMAEDVIEMIEKLQLGPVYLAGYDLGSGVAYNIASLRPDLVKKVFFSEFGLPGFGYESLLTPTPQTNSGSNWHLSFFTVPDVAEHFLKGKERDLLSWFFWHISHNPQAISHEDFEEYSRHLLKPGALRAGIEYYASVWKDSEINKIHARKKLPMPVLVAGGESSSGAYMKMLWEPLCENISAEIIKEAGHWLADEQPEQLSRIFKAFFSK